MHFERFVKGDPTDVRCRSYYVYRCNVCGYEHPFWWVANFDTARLRKCPECKVEDDTDNKEYLISQKQKLEQEVQDLSMKLNTKRNELEQASAKLEAFLLTEPTTSTKEIVNEAVQSDSGNIGGGLVEERRGR